MATFLLITHVSSGLPATPRTGLVTLTSTREQLGAHGVLLVTGTVFPAGTAGVLVAVISCLLEGWSRLLRTALSLQLTRTHGVVTGI